MKNFFENFFKSFTSRSTGALDYVADWIRIRTRFRRITFSIIFLIEKTKHFFFPIKNCLVLRRRIWVKVPLVSKRYKIADLKSPISDRLSGGTQNHSWNSAFILTCWLSRQFYIFLRCVWLYAYLLSFSVTGRRARGIPWNIFFNHSSNFVFINRIRPWCVHNLKWNLKNKSKQSSVWKTVKSETRELLFQLNFKRNLLSLIQVSTRLRLWYSSTHRRGSVWISAEEAVRCYLGKKLSFLDEFQTEFQTLF